VRDPFIMEQTRISKNTNSTKKGKGLSLLKPIGEQLVIQNFKELKRLSLDETVRQVLLRVGGSLRILVGHEGTTATVVGMDGRILGPIEDLMKVGTARSFINRELKLRAALPTSEKLNSFVYGIFANLKAENTTRTDFVAFEPILMNKLKMNMSRIEMVQNNLKFILERNTNPKDREQYVSLFKTMAAGIYTAYITLSAEQLVGRGEKERLYELLLDEGVPKYLHDKFINKMNLDIGSELFKVLFPSTIQKGMTLTVAEWRSEEFIKQLPSWLLENCKPIRLIIQDDPLLRSLCSIREEIPLDDISNDKVRLLLESKVHVMPPTSTPDYVIDAGLKGRIKTFPNTSMTGVKEVIFSIDVFFMRIYSGRLNVPDPVIEFGRLVIPAEFSSADIGPGNGLYHQWRDSPNRATRWLHLIRCEAEMRVQFERLFKRHVPGNTDANQRLNALVIVDPVDRTPPLPTLIESEYAAKETTFAALLPKGDEVIHSTSYRNFLNMFSKPGKRKEVKGFIQSSLTRGSKKTISILKTEANSAVYEVVDQYLRSFVSEEIQEAIAKVLMATFDKLISYESELEESENETSDIDENVEM